MIVARYLKLFHGALIVVADQATWSLRELGLALLAHELADSLADHGACRLEVIATPMHSDVTVPAEQHFYPLGDIFG